MREHRERADGRVRTFFLFRIYPHCSHWEILYHNSPADDAVLLCETFLRILYGKILINVAIHLRQGYGGQDVEVLPIDTFR